MTCEAEPREHRRGVAGGAVGEDELAAGKLFDRRPQRRIGFERRIIDLVDVIEKIVGLHAVLDHHPAQGGAVALVIILLQLERLVMGDLEEARDVIADARVDLLPEIDVMRVERVVEIEHPGLDRVEGARGRTTGACHGTAPARPLEPYEFRLARRIVIARSEATKQSSSVRSLDCFASLAMTI